MTMLLFVVFICLIFHSSLAYGVGDMTSCHSSSIVHCILRFFYLFILTINLYNTCIFCKFVRGLCFRNKHIIIIIIVIIIIILVIIILVIMITIIIIIIIIIIIVIIIIIIIIMSCTL